ncbi:alpha/beta fold hydrolase [Pelagibius sp. Alg239-R121]|uniref:alpha/beta fold hydrolase n=1 Tax=Pelagibius sp. Alg239-R121 TaxID=2993448 RepID=UPI0024A75E40|nr:alpha/beta fold hydrolase [Pelagibius sp. Alg239-R121]
MTKLSSKGTAYDLHGSLNAPVVVLIHGLGLTRATWDDYLPILSRHYCVLTYDLCGHGESALPERTPSLTVLSEQLRDLLNELVIARLAVVGFSLGGMINRRFAMDFPDRVTALGILNSPHERSPEAQALVEQRAARTEAGGPAATIETTLERWFTAEFRAERPEIIEQVRSLVLDNDPKNYALHRQVLAKGVVELIRPNPPITLPALVMTCENDSGSTPAMSYAIASEIEAAQTVIVPGLQHMGVVERPDLFAAALEAFLDDVPV